MARTRSNRRGHKKCQSCLPCSRLISSMSCMHLYSFMNIFHTVWELWPGHCLLYATKTRKDNSKTKNARVVFLVHDTSY